MQVEEIQTLVKQGYQLKNQINALTAQLREINEALANVARYRDDSNTGEIITPEITVKVTKRENVKWDQAKLYEVSQHISTFNDFVKYEIKPDVRAIKKAEGDVAKAFDWCKTVTPGAPTVKYELVEEEGAPF